MVAPMFVVAPPTSCRYCQADVASELATELGVWTMFHCATIAQLEDQTADIAWYDHCRRRAAGEAS